VRRSVAPRDFGEQRGESMTKPAMPPGDSDSRWVDGTLESGADTDSADASEAATEGREPGEEGTGVEIGQGEPSSFEPEEEAPPSSR
jgi:hypothetical protein